MNEPSGRESSEVSIDELTALALAGDPDQPVAPDAVPISAALASPQGLLPD